MDYSKLNDMCEWEREKAIFLIKIAQDLGMDTSGYGELAVNSNSGYTYLWLENYNFSLYMPINCKLKKSDVVALWTSSDNGAEEDFNLKDETSLKNIEDWTTAQEKNIKQED